jgi:hypothetical protein
MHHVTSPLSFHSLSIVAQLDLVSALSSFLPS